MSINRFHSLPDVVSLRDVMDRIFEDSIRPASWSGLVAGQIAVPVDLWETKDAYFLRADLPGLRPEEIEINVTADTVAIAGETKPAADLTADGWLRQERRTGKFQRAFTLPTQLDPDKVEASFENGVLHLTLPKAEAVRPKQIRISPRASAK